MSTSCKKMAAKAGAEAGAKAGAEAGAKVYDKVGAKAGVYNNTDGVWLASKAGVEAGTKAGALAGSQACVNAGLLASASTGAKVGAEAGAKAGAKAGAQAYDKAFVAGRDLSWRGAWTRGWPKADAEARTRSREKVLAEKQVEAEARAKELAEKEAYERVSGIPPPFFMEESEFKSKSHVYTEVFRYHIPDMDFWTKIQKQGKCYEIITIDMNNMFEQELIDRVYPENRDWKIFLTIDNGQSQQYFVRSDYWQKNHKYIGKVLHVGNRRVSFKREYKVRHGYVYPQLTNLSSDKGHNQTYYREVECHVEEEEDNTCLGSICNLSGGKSRKSKKNIRKSRKSRKSKKNIRKSNIRR
jgi:hypothetical protein